MSAPVIAIDGPSASGKGTIASRVAKRLGFHYLESGALYRLVALSALREGITDEPRLATLAESMDVVFDDGDTWLGDDCEVFPYAVLGTTPQDKKLAGVPVRINDPQCVAKTFPDYFAALRTLTA